MFGFESLLMLVSIAPGFLEPLVAYIDPGSGTMLLQLILAAAASAIVALKYTGGRIRDFLWPFGKTKPDAGDVSSDETDTTPHE